MESYDKKVPCNIVLPQSLKEIVKELAVEDNRSLNNMIVKILTEYARKKRKC